MKLSKIIRTFVTVFLIFLFVGFAWAQSPDIIESVSPNMANPGESDVEITINLDSSRGMPPIPPANISMESVTIGTIASKSNTRVSDYVVTAVFDFPTDTTEGVFDLTIVFAGPTGDIAFTETGTFTIGEAGATATTGTPLTTQTSADSSSLAYPIVDTGQDVCADAGASISCPSSGEAFYGQDAQHQGYQFSFRDNGGGTVTDLVTRLMWQQTTDSDGDGDIDAEDKLTQTNAESYCENLVLAGYSDWRLPHIKELYSLIDHRGIDPSAYSGSDSSELTPFIDNTVFDYNWGDSGAGERLIDSQYASDTLYVDESASNGGMMFGVNFADGRIKGYGLFAGRSDMTFFCMCVRDNTGYGVNNYVDNSDGTITDNATGLMWSQDDSGSGMNWEDALAWVQTQNAANYMGYGDWRMPNIKELQSIVDYTRSPGTTGSAAIDPLFNATAITNEAGETDYPYYWSSTTHVTYPNSHYNANYISFGRAMGYMGSAWVDVHGAGAQRGDPKSPADGVTYPISHGPQGDSQRVYNYARLVRDVDGASPTDPGSGTDQTTGLFLNNAGAYDGYTLFAPMTATDTYLIDNAGTVVHTWSSAYRPGLAVYLLENGNLLRTGNMNNETFTAGGSGGIVEQLDTNGNVVWSYTQSGDQSCLHHDVEYLPSGNILMIAWEMKTQSEAIDAGRDPSLLTDGELWPDTIIEVDPSTNTIVWEWHAWDHLIQDYDNTKPDFGVIADHPELIDLNYTNGPNAGADWTHFNSVEYIEEFDQILISVHSFSEIWVIDHSTTTAQAATHSGGTYGKGGDLLYRWGNSQAYGEGTSDDRKLYSQHDATWIPEGYPGAGNILIFNNGTRRPEGDYSSIEEIMPPVDASGNYTSNSAYGPDAATWTYTASPAADFYSENISGSQRLPNGNTLICEGATGTLFEVTQDGTMVWKYGNPVTDSGVLGTTDEIPTSPQGSQKNQVFKVQRYATDYPGLPGGSTPIESGSLKVTITPSGSVAAGAQWSVNGGAAWNAGGAVLSDLSPGEYTVTFKEINGWTTPGNQTVEIADGETAVAEGVYTEAAQAPTCGDGVQNGNETGVDCGGDCDPCPTDDDDGGDSGGGGGCFIETVRY